MICNIKKLLPATLALLSACWLSACSDNDDNGQDEWTATYVYLQRTDFLESNVKDFEIMHTPLGLSGTVSMDFSAKLTKPADSDTRVTVAVEGSELLPNTNFKFVDRNGNTLANNVLTIKAGQTSSDTIRMVCDDLSTLASIESADKESGYVRIDAIDTKVANMFVAKNPNMKQLDFCVDKSEKRYLATGELPESSTECAPSSLTLTLYGAYYYTNPQDLLDSNNGTYVLFYGTSGLGIQIDLGEEKIVTAIRTVYFSSGYAANNITVEIPDGDGWKEVGTVDVSGGTHTVNLLGKPKTRYIYYRLNGPYRAYLYMTQLHVYTE